MVRRKGLIPPPRSIASSELSKHLQELHIEHSLRQKRTGRSVVPYDVLVLICFHVKAFSELKERQVVFSRLSKVSS